MLGIAIIFGIISIIGACTVLAGLVLLVVALVNKERPQKALKYMMWGGLMLLVSFTLCTAIVMKA